MFSPKRLEKFIQRQFSLCRELLSLSVDDIERAHELRLVVKRLRAVHALIEDRERTKDRVLSRDLRFVSKSLGELRDHDVVMSWLIRHRKSLPNDLVKEVLEADATSAFDARRPVVVRSASRRLLALEKAFANSADAPRDIETLRERLIAEYSSAWKVFKPLQQGKGTASDFHELRKRSKALLFQIEALSDMRDGALRKYWMRLKTVSSLLGDAHDFTIIREYLKDTDGKHSKRVRRRLKEKRDALNVKAVKLAARTFTRIPPMAILLS